MGYPFENRSCLFADSSGESVFRSENGETWHSRGGWFILHYYDRQHPRPQQIVIRGSADGTVRLELTPSGGVVTAPLEPVSGETVLRMEAASLGLGLTVRMLLREDGRGFSVLVRDEDIRESNPGLYRLLSLEVLPEFGAARSGEPGYLTLPNWIGSQCFFDKKYPRELRQTIYSTNDQWEHNCNVAVFGVTRSIGTLCGIVAQGDADARLISRVHWEEAQANGTHPELVYRWQQEDERIPGTREVRYTFASPNDASGEGYVFCGKEYRSFLRRERGLCSWQEKAAVRPEAADYLNRFFLKIFMAYKDPQPDGRGKYHVTCSFDQTREIIALCLESGMKNLAVMLVGWNIDGHDGMVPTRFPLDDRLGGEAAFQSLLAFCRSRDVLLGVHDYYGGAYSCSPDFEVDDLIRHRTGEYWESVVWSGGQAHNICPAVYVEKHVKRYMPMLRDIGLHGHEHIDAIGSSMLCFSQNHPLHDRAQFFAKVSEMFRFANQVFGSVSTEYPFGPYLPEIDGLYHTYDEPMAWQRQSLVGRYFYDKSVPLLGVILHGSVNCGCRVEPSGANLMRMLAFGLYPQSETAMQESPAFGIPVVQSVIDDIQKAYSLFYSPDGIVPRLARATIEAQWERAPGVFETHYSTGDCILVNTTAQDFDGLPGNDWTLRRS